MTTGAISDLCPDQQYQFQAQHLLCPSIPDSLSTRFHPLCQKLSQTCACSVWHSMNLVIHSHQQMLPGDVPSCVAHPRHLVYSHVDLICSYWDANQQKATPLFGQMMI